MRFLATYILASLLVFSAIHARDDSGAQDEQAPGIVITSPEPGAKVRPGEQITVRVEALHPEALGKMRRILVVASPAFEALIEGDPPWTARVTVNPESIGRLKVIAGGLAKNGDDEPQWVEAQEFFIEVDLSGLQLERISLHPPWIFCDEHDPELQMYAYGHYSDGVKRGIGTVDSKTTYRVETPEIASVTAEGVVTCHAGGETRVIVTRDGVRGEVRITVEDPLN